MYIRARKKTHTQQLEQIDYVKVVERTARPQEICVFLHPGNIIPLLLLKKIPLFLIQTGHFLLPATGKGVLSQPLYNFKIAHNTATKITQIIYRKIPKISPGLIFFNGPFLRGLVLERLIFGGAYLRREICVSKSIGLALQLEVNLPFLLSFTLYLRAIFQLQAPGVLIFGGAI